MGTHQFVVSTSFNSVVLTDLLQRTQRVLQFLCFVLCAFVPYTRRLVCLQLPCLVYDWSSSGMSLMWGLKFSGGGGGGAGPYIATLMVSITKLVVRRVYH